MDEGKTVMGGGVRSVSDGGQYSHSTVMAGISSSEPSENQQRAKSDKHMLNYSDEDVTERELQKKQFPASQDMIEEENESPSLTENQKLAAAGEFEKLAEIVNTELSELGMQQDSVEERVGYLTKIVNAGNQEWRVWAGNMLIWHIEMAKYTKATQSK